MANPIPKDLGMYTRIKTEITRKFRPSAYRSGMIVKTYKRRFAQKYGTKKRPYSGDKTSKKGLSRWFREKWVNSRGKVGYQFKNDIYRPSKRITKKTPITFNELSRAQIKTARRTKYDKGRVNRFAVE
jgi:hypothetical protein